MSEPFLGDIKMFGFNFAPRGYAFCDGQLLAINQNQSLYSLLGTTYGGDGRTTFALPDLRGRVPIHVGNPSGGPGHALGSSGGEETHVLRADEMPSHTHQALATDQDASSSTPAGAQLAATASGRRALSAYGTVEQLTELRAETIGQTGANQGHENMQPYQTINFCIALQGLYPARS